MILIQSSFYDYTDFQYATISWYTEICLSED